MLRDRKWATGIEPVVLLGVLILSVFGARTGSASGRIGEISSGLEAGVKSEAWGGWIPSDDIGAFPATLIGSWKERPRAAGGVEGFRRGRLYR